MVCTFAFELSCYVILTFRTYNHTQLKMQLGYLKYLLHSLVLQEADSTLI